MIALSDNARGAIFMMVSMATFVCNDTIVKVVSADLPLFPTIFLRGVFASALLFALTYRESALHSSFSVKDRRAVGIRTAAEVGATLCFLTALFNMQIANAMAILQVMPLAVTLAAALFLREAVGWRRWSAIAVGFVGVLVIIQPGSEGFNRYSLWALAAVAMMVVRDLSTRQMTKSVPSVFVALITAVSITIVGGIGSLLQSWDGASLQNVGLLLIAAMFIVVAYLTNVIAMRQGEIGFVSPFRYSVLLWAIGLGWVVFGDIPSANMLIGSAIVIVTGVYTFYRERAVRQRAAAMRTFGSS